MSRFIACVFLGKGRQVFTFPALRKLYNREKEKERWKIWWYLLWLYVFITFVNDNFFLSYPYTYYIANQNSYRDFPDYSRQRRVAAMQAACGRSARTARRWVAPRLWRPRSHGATCLAAAPRCPALRQPRELYGSWLRYDALPSIIGQMSWISLGIGTHKYCDRSTRRFFHQCHIVIVTIIPHLENKKNNFIYNGGFEL